MSLMKWVISQGKKEYSGRVRITAMAFEGLIFVIIVPCLLVYLSLLENGKVPISEHPAFVVIGGLVAICGISLALWTVRSQFHKADGTPVPIMATKKLLIDKPYSFCRNPMGLGTILFYAGISVIVHSYLAAGVTIAIMLFLIVMIKTFEEKEMLLRFGEDYMRYKEGTPFMIPRIHWLKKKDGK